MNVSRYSAVNVTVIAQLPASASSVNIETPLTTWRSVTLYTVEIHHSTHLHDICV